MLPDSPARPKAPPRLRHRRPASASPPPLLSSRQRPGADKHLEGAVDLRNGRTARCAAGKPTASRSRSQCASRKKSLDVPIVLHADRAVTRPEQICVVGDIGVVGRIRIPHPLQVAQAPALPVVAAVVGCGSKGLSNVIGGEQCRAAGTAMDEGGLDEPSADRSRSSCSTSRHGRNTPSNWRPSRTVLMSPSTCSHSGFRARLTASMPEERSTRTI